MEIFSKKHILRFQITMHHIIVVDTLKDAY